MLDSFMESLILDNQSLRDKFVNKINEAMDTGKFALIEKEGYVSFALIEACDCEE